MNKELLTAKEVAAYLRIHERQIYRLIKEKKIPAIRVSRKWLFPKDALEEFINAKVQQSMKDIT
jgi:excisionase family DNA binding protein